MTATKKQKILIVEDNQENIDLLVYFLRPQGYQLIITKDGQSGLDKVSEVNPDIILLDIMLPKLDGFTVCEKLKKDSVTKYIPIIMITALKELKDKLRALEAGADDFISKPFENVELLSRVKSLLRLKEYHDELEKKNQELAKKNESLIGIDKFKEELTNLIVHDMKNPLFVIQGNIQMMSLGLESQPSDYLKKYTARIERSSQQLLRMIVNLLDISRIQEGTIVLNKDIGDLNKIIKENVDRIKEYPENEKKLISTDLDASISNMIFDRSIMERVAENMVNFSVNNIVDGGKVTITTKKVKDGKIHFIMHDNGTQIPKKFHDKIFEKFSQVEIKDDGYRVARGLGLIFCKMAIEAHKGRMWLDMKNTVGNRFIIEFSSVDLN